MREFRHQAMLQWFLNPFHILIMSAWKMSITVLGKWKINACTVSATAVASTFLASMSSGMLVSIEHTSPILHPEQPLADNFPYCSDQNTQYSGKDHWNHLVLLQEKGGT